jgi:glycosyltransferase involved in cell wall biosynthesis
LPNKFAEAVKALLTDPTRRERLALCGRSYVMENWQWERCVNHLEEYLASGLTSSVEEVEA